jgi:hypothetical protein
MEVKMVMIHKDISTPLMNQTAQYKRTKHRRMGTISLFRNPVLQQILLGKKTD